MGTNRVHEPEAFEQTRAALAVYDVADRAIDDMPANASESDFELAFKTLDSALVTCREAFITEAETALDARTVSNIKDLSFTNRLDFEYLRGTANFAMLKGF